MGLALLGALAPNSLETAVANGDTRTLFLYHSHSKELIAATFRNGGHYDSETLEKLNWFLRDWRTDEPTHMDPRLFDVLWEAYRGAGRNTGPDDPIVVVSAYRCPATNAMLRRRSRAVAEHSQHMLGKAMDTTMPGLSMEKLREIGMRMQRGGVGYYPTAGTPFVHLDVGGVRSWPRMNYDQLARLFPDGKTVHLPANGHPLAGYEEAKAEIEARGGETLPIETARSGGGIGGFFAALFGGGGGEDEEEGRVTMPPARAGRVAVASRGEESEAPAAPRQQMVAKAETNLPRGETFMASADAAQQSAAAAPPPERRRAQVASLAPAPAPIDTAARPEPLEERAPAAAQEAPAPRTAEEPADEKPVLANLPTPPRRPEGLAVAEAPLPPVRPVSLASLPSVITQGSSAGLRQSLGQTSAPLAYASHSSTASADTPADVPTPPSRAAVAPLRAAAGAKAAEAHVADQMAPVRVNRSNIATLVAPVQQSRAHPRGAAGGYAPPLRAAAKLDVLTPTAPAADLKMRFTRNAAQTSAGGFSKKDDE